MSKLDKIYIKGFKSIKEAEIELKSLNILIGANASGKTNFIQFLKMLNYIIEGRLQLFVGKSSRKADSLLYYGRKHTSAIEGKLEFGSAIYTFILVPTESNSLIFGFERALFIADTATTYTPFERSGHEETCLYAYSKKPDMWTAYDYVIDSLKNWIVYHFHDTSDTSVIKQVNDISDCKRLKPDASNLAAYLYFLQNNHNEHYQKIVSTIQLIYPTFDTFVLEPDFINERNIELEWRDKKFDSNFNAYSMSDGTLRFICLATLLLQPDPPETLIIDEPELGLHPYAITVLASLIKRAATESQVIISTQSVNLINHFSVEDIIVVDREDSQSKFKRLKSDEYKDWLDEYTLGDLWEKNIFGGRP